MAEAPLKFFLSGMKTSRQNTFSVLYVFSSNPWEWFSVQETVDQEFALILLDGYLRFLDDTRFLSFSMNSKQVNTQ